MFSFSPLNEILVKADNFQSEMDGLNYENSTSRQAKSEKAFPMNSGACEKPD